jgi:DNA invertase Pin-like site-specific DNA recombinase
LKVELRARQVRVVALDLPTSWAMATGKVDDFTARMIEAINGMLMDMLAAVARKDFEDRRRRQMQGQAKAQAEGKYVGRPEDKRRNTRIATMLAAGTSYSAVQEATGCSRATRR